MPSDDAFCWCDHGAGRLGRAGVVVGPLVEVDERSEELVAIGPGVDRDAVAVAEIDGSRPARLKLDTARVERRNARPDLFG